jgi:hypothetical protein
MGQGDDEPGVIQHEFGGRADPAEGVSTFEGLDPWAGFETDRTAEFSQLVEGEVVA